MLVARWLLMLVARWLLMLVARQMLALVAYRMLTFVARWLLMLGARQLLLVAGKLGLRVGLVAGKLGLRLALVTGRLGLRLWDNWVSQLVMGESFPDLIQVGNKITHPWLFQSCPGAERVDEGDKRQCVQLQSI